MNRSQLLPVLIALLAITSLSVASTTLETSLTTDPDDEINPDWDTLPIGEGDAAEIQESIEGDGDEAGDPGDPTDADPDDEADGEPDGEADGDPDGVTGGGDEGAEEELESGDGDEGVGFGGDDRSAVGGGGEAGEGGDAAGGSGAGDGAGSGSAEGMGSAGEEPSLLDRLMALLSVLLPIVAILTLAALAYRYREVLADFFGRDSETSPASQHRSAVGRWPGTSPENDVDRAWVEVIRRLNPERPETMTPDECRALARVRDVDHDAVESIVSAFERVHYGGSPVDAELDRARDGLSALEVRVE